MTYLLRPPHKQVLGAWHFQHTVGQGVSGWGITSSAWKTRRRASLIHSTFGEQPTPGTTNWLHWSRNFSNSSLLPGWKFSLPKRESWFLICILRKDSSGAGSPPIPRTFVSTTRGRSSRLNFSRAAVPH